MAGMSDPVACARRCAFLTLEDPADFVIDDELAVEPLRARGVEVESIPWRQPAATWDRFDVVVIRSPWDYHLDPEAFLAVLADVERSRALLANGLDLVRWNLRKTYLRDLAERGVPAVPTVWLDRLEPGGLPALFERATALLPAGAGAGAEPEMILKPVVGLNASFAWRLTRADLASRAAEVEADYARRPLMAQPFLRSVVEEGEFSLFYFNGEHSHTILKTPKPGDFRVQEEHGGIIRAVEAEPALRAAGARAMAAIGPPPLYARVDFVRAPAGEPFRVMEFELIEPALYFRMDHPAAAERFADALVARLGSRTRAETPRPIS